MEITDKVIIITGASAGIGRALAKELSARGGKVVLAARSADKLKALADEIPHAIAIAADMSKQEDVANLISQTITQCGRIDILVNNAGQGMRMPIEKIRMDDYRAIVELNVYGPLQAMQGVIPIMRQQGGGLIMNISSMVSKNYYPELGAYSSTKYALNSLSLTARAELEADKISVCVFHPKMTATEFGQNSRGEKYVSSAGRPGMTVDTPEEVAVRIAEQIESESAEENM